MKLVCSAQLMIQTLMTLIFHESALPCTVSLQTGIFSCRVAGYMHWKLWHTLQCLGGSRPVLLVGIMPSSRGAFEILTAKLDQGPDLKEIKSPALNKNQLEIQLLKKTWRGEQIL